MVVLLWLSPDFSTCSSCIYNTIWLEQWKIQVLHNKSYNGHLLYIFFIFFLSDTHYSLCFWLTEISNKLNRYFWPFSILPLSLTWLGIHVRCMASLAVKLSTSLSPPQPEDSNVIMFTCGPRKTLHDRVNTVWSHFLIEPIKPKYKMQYANLSWKKC